MIPNAVTWYRIERRSVDAFIEFKILRGIALVGSCEKMLHEFNMGFGADAKLRGGGNKSEGDEVDPVCQGSNTKSQACSVNYNIN
jgi:hypothetical protein